VGKKKKPSKGELQQNIANMIDHPELGALGTPFPREFRMVEVGTGRVCVEVTENRVIRTVSIKSVVIPAMSRYLREADVGGPLATLDIDAISAAVRYWASSTRALSADGIPPFLWANERPDAYTWHRLPFDRTEDIDDEAFPLWEEILNRIEEEGNRTAALLWIGSLFARDSYRQQYLWLYGQGGDSKGAVSRVLKRVLGGACKANLTPPSPGGDVERWCSNLIGVRLATFPDCNSGKFPGSGIFKQITGGDYLSGRKLYEEPVEFMPDAKVLFISNTPPKINDGAANARRAIICTLQPFRSMQWEEGDYEEELFRQAAAFCNYALTAYEATCPNGVIPCDTSNLSSFASSAFEDFEVLFDNLMVGDSNSCVIPSKLQNALSLTSLQRSVIIEFREWMQTNKGFVKRKVTAEESDRFDLPRGTYIYPGFRLVGDEPKGLTAVIDIGRGRQGTRVDIDG
jgi:hypothetical protein